MYRRLAVGSVLIALAFPGSAHLEAQQPIPVQPELTFSFPYQFRQPISPFFEGWYQNPDGTYTLSFGFYNRNLEESLHLSIGPDNFLEPAEFDGQQPTFFPALPDSEVPGREWAAFTVVVPEDFAAPGQDVVWTLRTAGTTHSVPGRVGNVAYQLNAADEPASRGTLSPKLRFDPDGPVGIGHKGITGEPREASVGSPLTLTIWAADNMVPGSRDPSPVGLRWVTHQAPRGGAVVFDDAEMSVDGTGGEATTRATFTEPGEYLLRVRADNFSAPGSLVQGLCCWTNGFVRVTVTP